MSGSTPHISRCTLCQPYRLSNWIHGVYRVCDVSVQPLGSVPIKYKPLRHAPACRNHFTSSENRPRQLRAQPFPIVDSSVRTVDGCIRMSVRRSREFLVHAPPRLISWPQKQGVCHSGDPRPRNKRLRGGEGEAAMASIHKLMI